LKLVDYAIWGALQEKVYPQRNLPQWCSLKLAIIDDTEILGSALLIANEWCQRL